MRPYSSFYLQNMAVTISTVTIQSSPYLDFGGRIAAVGPVDHLMTVKNYLLSFIISHRT